MALQYNNIIVSGMQTISQVAYLNQFNEVNFYKFALVDPKAENGYTPVTNAQYINCPNVIIFNKVPNSSNAAKYDIVGNIKLPNVQVYLSETDWTLDSDVPAESKLLTLSTSVIRNVEGMEPGKNYVLTDEEGNFSFKNIYGSNNYYVWAKVTNLFSLMMMPQFQVSVIQKVINYGSIHDYFIFKTKKISPPKCRTCGGAGFHSATTECPTCEGGTYSGPFTCPDCNGGSDQPCELCEGGSRSGPFTCPNCDGAGGFDIEVIEKHHNQKIDAPSGTALMIADAIRDELDGDIRYEYDRHSKREKRKNNEIGIHSVRGGTIVGEHDVLFCGRDEIITLSHSARSKDIFAVGAVNAALFIADKPQGLYNMGDLVKQIIQKRN